MFLSTCIFFEDAKEFLDTILYTHESGMSTQGHTLTMSTLFVRQCYVDIIAFPLLVNCQSNFQFLPIYSCLDVIRVVIVLSSRRKK